MTTNNMVKTIGKKGSLRALRQQFASGSGNDMVTVQDWQVSYGSNGLTESCTVTAKENSNSITSIGLLAYSVDGKTLYCSQFTASTNSNNVVPSVSAGGLNLQAGGQVLGVVFGYIEGAEFFFEQVLTIQGLSKVKSGSTSVSSPRQMLAKKSAKSPR
jgi:hypothetical protein